VFVVYLFRDDFAFSCVGVGGGGGGVGVGSCGCRKKLERNTVSRSIVKVTVWFGK